MAIVRVGIAELKSRLSEYLRVVRRGGAVTVFDRDTPVARLVPVDEPAALAEAIRSVLDDASLREELRQRGRRRGEQFRWELAADETLAVYAQVARA